MQPCHGLSGTKIRIWDALDVAIGWPSQQLGSFQRDETVFCDRHQNLNASDRCGE